MYSVFLDPRCHSRENTTQIYLFRNLLAKIILLNITNLLGHKFIQFSLLESICVSMHFQIIFLIIVIGGG